MTGRLHIDEFPPGHPIGAAQCLRDPRPLSYWHELLARTGGHVRGAEGEEVPVSMAPWDDAPEGTRLAIYVTRVDPGLVGTTDPDAGR